VKYIIDEVEVEGIKYKNYQRNKNSFYSTIFIQVDAMADEQQRKILKQNGPMSISWTQKFEQIN